MPTFYPYGGVLLRGSLRTGRPNASFGPAPNERPWPAVCAVNMWVETPRKNGASGWARKPKVGLKWTGGFRRQTQARASGLTGLSRFLARAVYDRFGLLRLAAHIRRARLQCYSPRERPDRYPRLFRQERNANVGRFRLRGELLPGAFLAGELKGSRSQLYSFAVNSEPFADALGKGQQSECGAPGDGEARRMVGFAV